VSFSRFIAISRGSVWGGDSHNSITRFSFAVKIPNGTVARDLDTSSPALAVHSQLELPLVGVLLQMRLELIW